MLGYTLKSVLELVPEVLPLVKQASIEEDYPVGTKADCLASALALEYKRQFTKDPIDYDVLEKVAQATDLFNVKDLVTKYSNQMRDVKQSSLTKQASTELEGSYMTKQANWEGDLSGTPDIREMAKQAEVLYETAKAEGVEPSSQVTIYAGHGYILKEAALAALGARYQATQDDRFVKIASALGSEQDIITDHKVVKSMCNIVSRMDSETGLTGGTMGVGRSFNFYKEACVEKSAGRKVMVKIAGQNYPLDQVMRIPSSYLDDYVGPGFSREMQNDPNSAAHIVQSLPADSQEILSRLLKNTR